MLFNLYLSPLMRPRRVGRPETCPRQSKYIISRNRMHSAGAMEAPGQRNQVGSRFILMFTRI